MGSLFETASHADMMASRHQRKGMQGTLDAILETNLHILAIMKWEANRLHQQDHCMECAPGVRCPHY